MKQKELTVYVCDFCRKKMFFPAAMQNHENECTKNPVNWDACIDCQHCEVIDKTIFFDTYHGESEKNVKSFQCNALNKTMYPHKAIKFESKYPESFENDELMPNPGQCNSYKEYYELPF